MVIEGGEGVLAEVERIAGEEQGGGKGEEFGAEEGGFRVEDVGEGVHCSCCWGWRGVVVDGLGNVNTS